MARWHWFREPASPDIDLKRLVEQLWGSQSIVTLIPHDDKIFLSNTVH